MICVFSTGGKMEAAHEVANGILLRIEPVLFGA